MNVNDFHHILFNNFAIILIMDGRNKTDVPS